MKQVSKISGTPQLEQVNARVIPFLKRAVLLGWIIVIGLYVLAFRPLQHRLLHLNKALDAATLDLANSPISTPESTWARFELLRRSIQYTQRGNDIWLDRVAFDFGIVGQTDAGNTKVNLLKSSRKRRSAQFKTLAQKHEMVIESQVYDTLSDTPAASGRWSGSDRESGLWAHGETLYQALTTAALCDVSNIQVAGYLPPRPHFNENSDSFLEDLPVILQVSGTLDSIYTFLSALPLAEGEMFEAGLPDFPGEKRPMFIDSLELIAVQDPLGNVEARIVIVGLFALNTDSTGTFRNVRNAN